MVSLTAIVAWLLALVSLGGCIWAFKYDKIEGPLQSTVLWYLYSLVAFFNYCWLCKIKTNLPI